MLNLSSLPVDLQFALFGLIFLAVFSQFFLLVYRYYLTARIRYCIFDLVLFILLLTLISVVTASRSASKQFFLVPVPYLAFVVPSVFVIAYSLISILNEYKKSKNMLSPNSVKQALDNLNSAICFVDDTGKIVLINHTMLSLAYSLSGRYPQMLSELLELIEKEKVQSLDGRIWKFSKVPLMDKELEGFSQVTALDITELYSANEQLKKENSALAETNEKIQLMLERLSQRIREQETLNLKMQIHNDIGTSLIALSKMMKGDENENMQTQLSTLENAVGYLSANRISLSPVSKESSVEKARKNGVELIYHNLDLLSDIQQSTVISAADESVTNCIKHAKGNKVTVNVTETEKMYTATIINNGNPPENEVVLGGGLTSLKRKIESAGGKMYFTYLPEFALNVELEKRNENND